MGNKGGNFVLTSDEKVNAMALLFFFFFSLIYDYVCQYLQSKTKANYNKEKKVVVFFLQLKVNHSCNIPYLP